MNQSQKKPTESKASLVTNLRAQIKTRMEKMNTNVRALERKAGLNVGVVNNILNGASANPTAETLSALADAFSCSIDELLNRNSSLSNEVNIDAFAPYDWNKMLFANIMTEFDKEVGSRGSNISAKQALQIIEEIYLYALKKNRENVDSGLIEYLLDKVV